jgi:uncharacterized BrkB/YihY/UPF0761 family membrane protein
MRASTLSFRAGILFLLAGMVWGLQMAMSNDHAELPAHAHLNLLGFVALYLFGFYYRLNPAVEAHRLAAVQVWVWIGATIVTVIGVGMVYAGSTAGDPVAAIGSLIAFADAVLFAWLVFQLGSEVAAPTSSAARQG